MAERRMFAKSIIGSARFLRMPPTSRLLYYDLGMAADDDGVVEAFSVMRTTGANEDDLRVLASKRFVRVLNEDLVTYISDWSRNNLIKKDRYHPSVYHELIVQLSIGTQMEPDWNPSGTHLEPEVRLGKDRLGKARIGEGEPQAAPTSARFVPPTVDEVRAYCQERQNSIDPEQFVNYYQARGWKYKGGQPMEDWKAAVQSWEKREPQRSGYSAGVPPRSDHLKGFHTEDEEEQ